MFQEPSPDVKQWLECLNPSRFMSGQRINISDQMALDAIRYQKLDVRRSISDFFQNYISPRRKKDAALEAGRVISQIQKLNSEISNAEKMLKRRGAHKRQA
jgi:hypothetical protein